MRFYNFMTLNELLKFAKINFKTFFRRFKQLSSN
jgi:hypothetical protein